MSPLAATNRMTGPTSASHGNLVRAIVPVSAGAETAELLTRAAVESLGLATEPARRLMMVMTSALRTSVAPRPELASPERMLELELCVLEGQEQLVVSIAETDPTPRQRELLRDSGTPEGVLRAFADTVELIPRQDSGPAVRASLEIGARRAPEPRTASGHKGPISETVFGGPLFLGSALPRIVAEGARVSGARHDAVAKVMLLAHRAAAALLADPTVELTHALLCPSFGRLDLMLWPLPESVARSLAAIATEIFPHADNEITSASGQGGTRHLEVGLDLASVEA